MSAREQTNREASGREPGEFIPRLPVLSPAVMLMYHPPEHPSRDARLPLSLGRPRPGDEGEDFAAVNDTAMHFWTGETDVPMVERGGGAPIRVPRVHRTAITAWASESSYGVPTTLNGQRAGIRIARPMPQFPTRGVRGVSGVYATVDKSASRSFVPAVFVPTSVVTGRR